MRICADHKVTVNPHILIDKYPIPTVNEVLTEMHGGEYYARIDLREAYAQVKVSDQSKKILTINTHKGLYWHNKMPYGVAAAPGFFQKRMEGILGKIKNVKILLDDIYIKSKSISEMINIVKKVFEVLRESGLKIKKEKCIFFEKKNNIIWP